MADAKDDPLEFAKQLDTAKQALAVERQSVSAYIDTNKLLNEKIDSLNSQLEVKIQREDILRTQLLSILNNSLGDQSQIVNIPTEPMKMCQNCDTKSHINNSQITGSHSAESLLEIVVNTKEEFSDFKNQIYDLLNEEKGELLSDRREFDRIINLIIEKSKSLEKELGIAKSECAELRARLAETPAEISDRERQPSGDETGEIDSSALTIEELAAKIKGKNAKLGELRTKNKFLIMKAEEMQTECNDLRKENVMEKERTNRRYQQYRSANTRNKQLTLKCDQMKAETGCLDVNARQAVDVLHTQLIETINSTNVIPLNVPVPQFDRSLPIDIGGENVAQFASGLLPDSD